MIPELIVSELSRVLQQLEIVADEPDELRRQLYLSGAYITLANIRTALTQPHKPLRKLAIVGRYDLVQQSGRPPDREIEARFLNGCAANDNEERD